MEFAAIVGRRNAGPPYRGGRNWFALFLAVALWGLGAPRALRAQEGLVAGTVLDAQSLQPLAGAQVVVSGTQLGALSDARGRFQIVGISGEQAELRVIMIGYKTTTRTVRVGSTDVRILLAQSAVPLEELVVTGAPGETQMRAVGNSVAKVNASTVLQARPVESVESLLQGQVPGITVRAGQGNLGTGGLIRLRGVSSLSLSNQPLVYVDGVRVNNDPLAGPSIRGGSQTSRLDDIDPENIESIQVINGPSAATLYGTEASNGVILITTKRGTRGKPTVSLTLKGGANYFENPEGRLPTNYWRDPSTGTLVSENLYANELAAGRHPFTDGPIRVADLQVEGGSDNVHYFTSLGYDDSQGMVSYNWLKKYNLRGNVELVPSDQWDINVSLGYVNSDTRYGQAANGWDLMTQFIWGSPSTLNTRLRGFLRATPEAAATIDSRSKVDRTTVSVEINQHPYKWLTNRLAVGTDVTGAANSILFPRSPEGSADFFGAESLGDKTLSNNRDQITSVDLASTAALNVTPDVAASTSAGAQYFLKETEILSAEGLQFPVPPITTIGGAAQTFANESFVENKTAGVFVQEQLSWKNRRFITAAVRFDDNSAFGANFNFVTYPKVSASWVLNEEPFWKVAVVDALKLRAAWGVAGQQPDVFAAAQLYQPATGPGDVSVLTPQTIGNPNLRPEKGEEIELGFDAGLFSDRLGLQFTYYNQDRKDAILAAPIAPSSGFPGVEYLNLGLVRDRGVELGARAHILNGQQLGWELDVNYSTNHSMILDLGGLPPIATGTLQLQKEGYPVGAFFMRRVVSAQVDANGKVTQAMCKAASGPPVDCADASPVYAGQPNPTWFGSVTNTVTLLRNIRLDATVDFQGGFQMINGDIAASHLAFRNSKAINTGEYPILQAYDQVPGFSFYECGLYNAGWAKLRNVSATYTLPERMVARFGASRASVTLAAQNVAIVWQAQKYIFGRQVIDPEVRTTSSEQSGYVQTVLPQMSSIVATVHVTF
jgi:TonB-linked SusC/RagA family outer membrane protein